MITAIFTRGNSIGGKLISWGTKRKGQSSKECPSHVAFRFNDVIFESTLFSGVREVSSEEFYANHTVITEIDLGISEESTYRFLEKARAEIKGSGYDFPALMYFSLIALMYKAGFYEEIPTKNRNYWNFKNKFFCVEVYSIITGEDYSLVSPNDLMILLVRNNYNVLRGLVWSPYIGGNNG